MVLTRGQTRPADQYCCDCSDNQSAPPPDDNCIIRLRRRNIFTAAADVLVVATDDDCDNCDATARLNIHKVARSSHCYHVLYARMSGNGAVTTSTR